MDGQPSGKKGHHFDAPIAQASSPSCGIAFAKGHASIANDLANGGYMQHRTSLTSLLGSSRFSVWSQAGSRRRTAIEGRINSVSHGECMRLRRRYAALLLMLIAAGPVLAQAPKPNANANKLELWVGTWTYAGEAKATALGPAAKIGGTQTGRMVMSGAGFEWKGEEQGVFGAVQWSETDVYDAATKTYPFLGYQSDGTTWSGANTI